MISFIYCVYFGIIIGFFVPITNHLNIIELEQNRNIEWGILVTRREKKVPFDKKTRNSNKNSFQFVVKLRIIYKKILVKQINSVQINKTKKNTRLKKRSAIKEENFQLEYERVIDKQHAVNTFCATV